MRRIGDEIYVQRGETWSLDFELWNSKGHPFTVLNAWRNPYLVITVSASLYEQAGSRREVYWLDLNKRYVEQKDGTYVLEPLKRFTSADVLMSPGGFNVDSIMSHYGEEAGGKLTLDTNSDFCIKNFLFFVDPTLEGNNVYKYLESNENGAEIWKDYNFRIIKCFSTNDWTEQRYYLDMKLVAGPTVQEYVKGILESQGVNVEQNLESWTNEMLENYISQIADEKSRINAQRFYESGEPLVSYDMSKSVLQNPMVIYVSSDIQGGMS